MLLFRSPQFYIFFPYICVFICIISCQSLIRFYLKLTRVGLLLISQGEMDLISPCLGLLLRLSRFFSKALVIVNTRGMQKHV